MKLTTFFSNKLSDNLRSFRTFEIILAVVCITIPVLLRITDPDHPAFRNSISDYVNMRHSYLFGMLLCVPAMLFMFNGAAYFRKEPAETADPGGKWYNLILGTSLLLVICFNCNDYNTVHTLFASVFFFGNAIVFAVFNKKHRVIGITLAILTAILLVLGKCYISLLWGEWFSLTVIGFHFILMTEGIISIALSENLAENRHYQKIQN